jgi:hypothetical protein
MKATEKKALAVVSGLPEDLLLVPAPLVRTGWNVTETRLHRADKDGTLPRLRIGKRAFYRLTDLRAFLNRAQAAPPVAVPWTPAETAELQRQRRRNLRQNPSS